VSYTKTLNKVKRKRTLFGFFVTAAAKTVNSKKSS